MDGAAYDRWRLMRRRASVDWERVTSTRPGVRLLELPDTSMRVRVQGDGGHAVVFFCDPPNLVEHLDEVFAQFSDEVAVVCLEQPSFGFSFPKQGYGFAIADHARATTAALEALPFETYTLAAPCVAAYGAMRAARDRPDLVKQLVLMQAADWATERAWIERTADKFVRLVTGVPRVGHLVIKVPFLAQLIASRTEPVFGERTYSSVIYKAAERSELVASLIQESSAMFALGACNCMSSLSQVYFRGAEDDFTGFRQPTLILWGDSDPSHATTPRDALRRYAPDARVERIEETGHHLEIENPKAVCDRIRAFVSTRSG